MAPTPILTAVLATAIATFSLSAADPQIRLPRLPRNIPEEILRLDRLPSLDDLLNRQPLTSSLEDAVTEVAFLDGFSPSVVSPLLELPFGFDDGVTMVPGAWSGMLQSYCLKAGTYGPTRGDGYLWAPLKGPRSEVIKAILNRSALHPEIPQSDIQVLLWGIIARSKVSTLGEGPRRAAERLLNDAEIGSIDGSALDIVPDEWLRKITGPIEGPIRRILEAENRIRQLLANPAGVAYAELERVAVLNGVPPRSERGRDIPGGRWSWHPNGFFIRFLPESYTNLELQIYSPERFLAERDADGALSALRDAAGTTLRIQYSAGAPVRAVLTVAGGTARTVEVRAGEEERAAAGAAVQTVTRFAGAGRAPSVRVRDVADVALLVAGIEETEAAAFLQRAWASAAGAWVQSTDQAAALERARHQSASLGGLFAPPLEAPAPPQGGWGGGGGGSGGGGGGGGMPGGGRQRLGPSLRKFGDDNSIDRARNAVNKVSNANDLLGAATDPAGLVSGGITGALFGRILDFNFDSYETAAGALAGDPPREDFKEFSKPVIPEIPTVVPGPDLTPERADRLNALMRDLITANAYMQAGIVALDRHGGAVKNGDRLWATRQAHALTYLKREAGVLSLRVVEHLEALTKDAPADPGRTMLIDGIRELGGHFASLPVIGAPW